MKYLYEYLYSNLDVSTIEAVDSWAGLQYLSVRSCCYH